MTTIAFNMTFRVDLIKDWKLITMLFFNARKFEEDWSKLKIIIIIRILLNRIFLSYPHLRNSLLIYETLYLVSYIILWAKTWTFVICLHCIANNFKAFNALSNNWDRNMIFVRRIKKILLGKFILYNSFLWIQVLVFQGNLQNHIGRYILVLSINNILEKVIEPCVYFA